MLKSMTGFGKGECRTGAKQMTVEIKSVNHRYSDITVKMPRELMLLEDSIRKQVQKIVARGKVDVFVTYVDLVGSGNVVKVDQELARSYLAALHQAAASLSLPDHLSAVDLLRIPELFCVTKEETTASETGALLENALDQALSQLSSMRETEGSVMYDVFLGILTNAEQLFAEITQRAPSVPREYKEKLESRLQELLQTEAVDPQRLAAEVAIFADKCSIDEEIARMQSHFLQFRRILEEDNAVGRKLDFLVQEMNREINTIGSKANDLEITNRVISLKSELEKIREQVQNVE